MIKSFKPIANLLFVFGMIMLSSGVVNIYRINKFRSHALPVEGKVSRIETNGPYNEPFHHYADRYGRTRSSGPEDAAYTYSYAPIVTYYPADGNEHTLILGKSYFSTYFIGDKVNLYYDKNDPGSAQLAGWDAFLPAMGYIGLGLLLMSFKFIRLLIRKNKQLS